MVQAAEPPQLKLYSVPYNAPKEQCQKDVDSAFEKAGYVKQTAESEDGTIVATKEGYKAIISCIKPNSGCTDSPEIDRVVIAVTGGDAEGVKTKAAELVDLFYVL
jgi:hypothetical protein